MVRSFFLPLFIVAALLCCNRTKGLCQEKNNYKRIEAIDLSKQDSLQKLILFYAVKDDAERTHSQEDTGYILALLKIASYENSLHNDASKAIVYTTQAMHIVQSFQQPDSSRLAEIYYKLALLYYAIRSYDKSKLFFEKTIEITNPEYLPDIYFNARMYGAVVDDLLGDFEKVGKDSRLAMAEAIEASDSARYIQFLYLHCRAMMFQNQLPITLSEAKQLEKWAKKRKDIFYLANAYNIQGNVYSISEDFKTAEQFFKLALSTRLASSDCESKANDCNELAYLYTNGLLDYKQAQVYYNKSLLYAKACPADRKAAVFLTTYSYLANLFIRTQEYSKANSYYKKAFRVVNIDLPDSLSSAPSIHQLSAIGEKSQILMILSSKCGLLLKLFKETNKKIYLQQCINIAITADSLIVQMRHEQTGDNSKLFWRDATHALFSEAMEACYLSGDIGKAFFFMEKSRSVLLNDKLNELSSTASYLPQQLALNENGMIADISQQQMKLALLSASSPDYTNTLQILETKQDSLDKYIHSIEKKYPLYYQYKYADDVPSFGDVYRYLTKNNQSLIYYFAADSGIYVLGITKSGTRFLKVPAQSFDRRQLSQFTLLCSNRQECNRNYSGFSSLANTIYKNIFEPLHLPAGNVTICTDNFFIPFDALCSDEKGKKFLLYDYNFSYTYSARSLLKPFASRAKPEGDFAGFAPVEFVKNLDVFSLHHSASALQTAAGFYNRYTLFTAEEATRSCFFEQASRYAVLTIFSHAQADTSDKEPVLYMQDSLIHLSELQKLANPATQFVLLSACQTNAGKSASGEGIYSLARGFAAAGVPAVSATLWKADEETIYSISAKFNEHLSQGMSKSEALRQAKIWYLQNSDLEHALPFYWANLVLIGSSDPIAFSQPDYSWIWLVTGLLITLLIFIFFVYRNKRNRVVNVVGYEA